jgi:hypothetical protein
MKKTPLDPASMADVVFVSYCICRHRQQFACFDYTIIRDNFITPVKVYNLFPGRRKKMNKRPPWGGGLGGENERKLLVNCRVIRNGSVKSFQILAIPLPDPAELDKSLR